MNSISLPAAALTVFQRELTIAWRRAHDVLTPLIFFAIVTSLFPLGVGPEPSILRTLAPGVLWVGALLSTMLSLNRLFANDYAEGTLEQLLLANVALPPGTPHPPSAAPRFLTPPHSSSVLRLGLRRGAHLPRVHMGPMETTVPVELYSLISTRCV